MALETDLLLTFRERVGVPLKAFQGYAGTSASNCLASAFRKDGASKAVDCSTVVVGFSAIAD